MTNHFCVRYTSGRLVSLLNPMEEPYPRPISGNGLSKPETEVTIVRLTRKFRCAECAKIFTTAGHLSRHATVHSGEKNFSCPFPQCSKRCSRHDNLLQHLKIHLSRPDRDKDPEYLSGIFSQMAGIFSPEQVASLMALQARLRRVSQNSAYEPEDMDCDESDDEADEVASGALASSSGGLSILTPPAQASPTPSATFDSSFAPSASASPVEFVQAFSSTSRPSRVPPSTPKARRRVLKTNAERVR